MNSLYFLAIAVVIALVGMMVLGLRSRKDPAWDSSIYELRERLDALKPSDDDPVQWAIRTVNEDAGSVDLTEQPSGTVRRIAESGGTSPGT